MIRFQKRLLILCGHYGSGKTNVALSLAREWRKSAEKLAVADLDIVNPYFRTKDSAAELQAAGIRLICSQFANTNLDLPAMPPDLYALTDDKTLNAVLDIGGDDRGALALGRLTPAILQENNYEMWMVLNAYRPLTRTAADVLTVKREIEAACGIPFTGLLNNSNLGEETLAKDILDSMDFAKECETVCNLPLRLTTVREELYPQLAGKIPDLFPLQLQKKIV